MNYFKIKLPTPVLAVVRYIPTFGGNITMSTVALWFQIQDIGLQKSSQFSSCCVYIDR